MLFASLIVVSMPLLFSNRVKSCWVHDGKKIEMLTDRKYFLFEMQLDPVS